MKVKNINGTSAITCKCGSWLDHWKKYSDQAVSYCIVENCYERAEVGAHVQRDITTDSSWYILPLCKKHNAETGKALNVSDGCKLVSANVSATCGK